jgi:V-ATPase subunit H
VFKGVLLFAKNFVDKSGTHKNKVIAELIHAKVLQHLEIIEARKYTDSDLLGDVRYLSEQLNLHALDYR